MLAGLPGRKKKKPTCVTCGGRNYSKDGVCIGCGTQSQAVRDEVDDHDADPTIGAHSADTPTFH